MSENNPVDTEIELKSQELSANVSILGRKVIVTVIAMALVVGMLPVAHWLPVVERLYNEATSTLVLLVLSMTSGNVLSTFIERKYGAKNG